MNRFVISAIVLFLPTLLVTDSPGIAADSRVPAFRLEPPSAALSFNLQPDTIELHDSLPVVASIVSGKEHDRAILADVRGTVRIWDWQQQTVTVVRQEGRENLACVALSPDGRSVALADLDGSVTLAAWEPTSEERSLKNDLGSMVTLRFFSSGQRLAGCTAEGKIAIWDTSTGQRMRQLASEPGSVQSLAVSDDEKWLAVAAVNRPVRLFGLATNESRELPQFGSRVTSVAFAPDGDTIAVGSADGTIRLGSIFPSEAQPKLLADHTFGVWQLLYSPRGDALISAGLDGTIKLWNGQTLAVAGSWRRHGESISALVLGPGGRGLLAAGLDRKLHYWPPDSPSRAAWGIVEGQPGPVWVAEYSPHGKLAVFGGGNRWLALFDVEQRRVIRELPGHSVTRCASFSPDASLLATGGDDRLVHIWNVESGELQQTLKGHPGLISAAVFSPDGTTLATACDAKVVRLWDTRHWQARATWKTERQIYCAAFSQHGRWLVTGGGNWTANIPGELKLWDASTGKLHASLDGHRLAVWTALFLADDTQLVSSSSDGTVRIWNLETMTEERKLEHGTWLRPLALTPDHRQLAVGRGDGVIRVWDTRSWQVQHSLVGHRSFSFDLDFSPDGGMLISAGEDRTVRFWKTGPHNDVHRE